MLQTYTKDSHISLFKIKSDILFPDKFKEKKDFFLRKKTKFKEKLQNFIKKSKLKK